MFQERNGLPLPEWTKTVYPGKMKYLASLSLALFTHNDIMRRLNGVAVDHGWVYFYRYANMVLTYGESRRLYADHFPNRPTPSLIVFSGVLQRFRETGTFTDKRSPLVGDIAQHMADKSSGALSASQKLFLYSAHDLTIVNVWRTLGMTEMLKPESGAALIVELHLVGTNKDFQIELLYINNTSTIEPHPLTIERCGRPCLLSNFLKLMEPVIPTDWEKECQLSSTL
uniref:DUF4817 domain-containing protein n=1 Tax=Timema shepardi TaxID=629360 RepID=A0A7R9G3V6_TIMSH|nr:unnamed protein product [Timema shepardi]